MLFYLVCNILFLPTIYSSSIKNVANKTSTTIMPTSAAFSLNETKIKLVSEGGSEIPIQALPNINQTALELDIEAGRAKETSIKARKGAFMSDYYSMDNKTSLPHNDTSISYINNPDNSSIVQNPANKTLEIFNVPLDNTTAYKSVSEANQVNKTLPKKPLKLVYEDLEIYTQKISPETLDINQIPSKEVKKYEATSANSHPGMVMPIVITILLVPIFAVLAFMAIRRGKEAWKNRHYKRMDFLLDGMYND